MTPTEFRRLYLTHLVSLYRAPETVQWYTTLLDRFEGFAALQGIDRWEDVTPTLLLSYQGWAADRHDRWGKPHTVAVRNVHLIVLRGLFTYLHEAGYMPVNPAAGLTLAREPRRLPKPVPSVKQMDRFIALPDIRTLLGFRDRVIMEVFYSTGIRLAELNNLRVEDIDTDHGFLMVRKGKGRKDRVVPVGRMAGLFLKVYLRRIRRQLCCGGRPDTRHVFLTPRGGRYSSRAPCFSRSLWSQSPISTCRGTNRRR